MAGGSLLKLAGKAAGKKVVPGLAETAARYSAKPLAEGVATQTGSSVGKRIVQGGAEMAPDIAPELTRRLDTINTVQDWAAPLAGKDTDRARRAAVSSAINSGDLEPEMADNITKAYFNATTNEEALAAEEHLNFFLEDHLDNQIQAKRNNAIRSFTEENADDFKATPIGDSGRELPFINKEFADAQKAGASEEELKAILDRGGYQQLKPEYTFLSSEEVLHNPDLVETIIAKTDKLEDATGVYAGHINTKTDLQSKPLGDPAFDRKSRSGRTPKQAKEATIKQNEKNIKTSVRDQIHDPASLNPLTRDQMVMGMNRPRLKLEAELEDSLSVFAEPGMEWHHTFFGNKDGASIFLQKVTQEPMIALNLMALLKRLDIPTSGTIGNLTALRKADHTKLHNIYRELGLEQGRELDFAGYMKAIGDAYLDGTADVNQFFRMIEIYQEEGLPLVLAALEEVPHKRFGDTGIKEFAGKYSTSKIDVAQKRKLPGKRPLKEKVVAAPTGLKEISPGVAVGQNYKPGKDKALDAVLKRLAEDPSSLDSSGFGGSVGGDLQRIMND